jgi:hypothetical protein
MEICVCFLEVVDASRFVATGNFVFKLLVIDFFVYVLSFVLFLKIYILL